MHKKYKSLLSLGVFVCSLVDCDEYRQNSSAFNVIVTEKKVCIKFSFSSMVHSINEWTMTAFHLLRSNQTCVLCSPQGRRRALSTHFVASFLANRTTQQEAWLLSRHEITPEIMPWFGRQQDFLNLKLKQILALSESWSFRHLGPGII